MGKGKTIFILLLVFGISTCWGGESAALDDNNLAIHTYGGLQLFQTLFQALSMFIYGINNTGLNSTFIGILRIAMTVGGFCAITMAFTKHSLEPILKNFFLPCTFIMCCVLLPQTSIHIQDHLLEKDPTAKNSSLVTVTKVPFVLGKLATLISTVSYKFVRALEDVAHGTGEPSPTKAEQNPDMLYNWTGHIYAGENIFQAKKCRIGHPALEDNFREFCRECVFRDIGIGLYSKDELIHTTNILEFLGQNTSQIRTCYYRDIYEQKELDEQKQNKQKNLSAGGFIPCREAIKKMNALFAKTPENTNLKNILIGEVGDDFKFLLKNSKEDQKDLQNIIKQQMAIHVLKEEVPGTLNSFAAKRAELLQRENQKTLGAMAAKTIVVMHNYFEAFLYIAFPLIVVYSLMAFGAQKLLVWCQLLLWVNSWPILFVVIKFILNSQWTYEARARFGDSINLTIFTSDGLMDMYSSMESIAGATMVSIPFLAWFLIHGASSQLLSIASSILSPAQSAASTVAAEKTFGNYNYGNLSLDNQNAYNAQTFRQTYSGLLTSGSVSLDSGTETMTYTPSANSLYIKQSDSYLREGVSRSETFGSAVQDSLNHSQSSLQEASKGYSVNLADSSNKAVGLVQALSKQFQTSESSSNQTTTGLQEAVQYMHGIGNDYAHANGINNDQALREVMSAGIGFSLGVKGSADINYQDGVSKSEAANIMAKSFDSETFQKHLQTIKNASHGEVANVLGSEDLRLHEDFSKSFNQTLSSSDQLRAAYTEHEALSNLKSYSSSEDVRIHQNLNQRFVDFLTQKYHDTGKINEILDMPSELGEKHALIQEFVKDFIPRQNFDNNNASIKNSYLNHAEQVNQVSEDQFSNISSDFIRDGEQKIGHTFGEMQATVDKFKSNILNTNQEEINSLSLDKTRIEENYNDRKGSSEEALDSSTTAHFIDKASSINSVCTIYHQLFGASDQPSKPRE